MSRTGGRWAVFVYGVGALRCRSLSRARRAVVRHTNAWTFVELMRWTRRLRTVEVVDRNGVLVDRVSS